MSEDGNHRSDDGLILTDKPKGCAFVLHASLKRPSDAQKPDLVEAKLAEAVSLTRAINLEVVHSESIRLQKARPSTLIGKGSCERLDKMIEELEPEVVIINCALSPIQQRNLESLWNVKVIDRTGLILEIFGNRAKTREGCLQVDLASLQYQRTRLVKAWSHLERQRGGAGFMGGPGETQLEIDRRLIDDKISRLKLDLQKVSKRRDLERENREKTPFPVVALVGYTNAGKSTLFNALTGSDVFAQDLLFATLDPTMRKIELSGGLKFILADTVGFISDLPTQLIAAFRSTLEQVVYADVILHVRDVSSHAFSSEGADVCKIMNELGVEYESDDRIIEVWNKIDLISGEKLEELSVDCSGLSENHQEIAVSAVDRRGFEELLEAITLRVGASRNRVVYRVPYAMGKAISWLRSHGDVIEEVTHDTAMEIVVGLDHRDVGRVKAQFGLEASEV